MKLLSWNVRGLGGSEKRKEVHLLFREKSLFKLFLQETRLRDCNDFLYALMWCNSPHAFSFRPSIGASGIC